MRIFVDIDGTLTNRQVGRSFFKKEIGLREDVIAKVKQYYLGGHEIILWTGNTGYARRVAEYLLEKHQIVAIAAVGKPDMIIDNEVRKFVRRFKRRIMTPEAFLTTTPPTSEVK